MAGAGVAAAGHDRPRAPGEESPDGPGVLFQVARVSARIEPFDGDYRAAIGTIRRFAGALAASPGVERVRVSSLPLELSPEQTLTGDAEAVAGTAAFEIRVVLRTVARGRFPSPFPAAREGAGAHA